MPSGYNCVRTPPGSHPVRTRGTAITPPLATSGRGRGAGVRWTTGRAFGAPRHAAIQTIGALTSIRRGRAEKLADEITAAAHADLAEDRFEVVLDRVSGYVQRIRDEL